ncbi:MMPL family transporter [bacterium]|nr:MMPL family transporter [bacterium]
MKQFFNNVILEYPKLILLLLIIIIGVFAYQARYLEIDASSETLMLDEDKDLALSRLFNERFKSQDFLFITFKPKGDLLSDKNLDIVRRLRDDLLKLERVDTINSILDVPLLESPPKPVKELLKDVPTLESPGIDRDLAKKEFLSSPIYANNLVSPDFKRTALLVNLHDDEIWKDFIKRRDEFFQKEKEGTLTPELQTQQSQMEIDFKKYRDQIRQVDHENIARVRSILDKYRGEADDLFLGGVTMIADDLITFVKNDLKVFGLAVLLFLIVMLWIIFRELRWIILPILTCSFSVIATAGLLGMTGWEVTVVSSNFISIQLIITMAMTIHLIVRYRELVLENPNADQRELVLDATYSMAKPCFFAILTTMAGFCSLIFCDIKPIINFGWMMTAGIGISLIITFLVFPAVMMQMEKTQPNTSFEKFFSATKLLAVFTEKHGGKILVSATLILIFSLSGSAQLIVENSFIDYFKDSTEIYQGMKTIDKNLGGTTPLEVVIDFEEEKQEIVEAEGDDEFSEFDEFEEEFEAEKSEAQYWFTAQKMKKVEMVHDYLDNMTETGKVLSLGTMLKIGRTLNDGDDLDNFLLALIYNELPDKFKKIILNPYVSVEHNQARFSIRMIDSDPNLRRNEFLKKLRYELVNKLGLEEDKVHIAGMMVMYNNTLQSLFDSQIKTLGIVLFALMCMFLILFRSLKIAVIAIFPNVLSVGVVLGFMGWAGIPLDLMTITIAAISVGIAVDDTIHYIHRFKREFAKDRNYTAAMYRSHESIGYAMYYTSITIIIGFSILVLSNFIPSIYFGLLTGLAMVIALIAALTLLPRLIVVVKPLGPEGGTNSHP